MDSNIMVIGLVAVALFTSLTTEAIKKILDEKQVKYSANILAAVVAVVLTVAASIGYIIYASILVTPQVVVCVIAMVFLAFLCATVGYDKVIQAIEQLKKLTKIS